MSNVQERAEAYAKGEMNRIEGVILAEAQKAAEEGGMWGTYVEKMQELYRAAIASAFVIGYGAGQIEQFGVGRKQR